MEKSDKDRQSTEPEDSHDVPIAEEMAEDESQNQQASESLMQDEPSVPEIREETKIEAGGDLLNTGMDTFPSPEPVFRECQKEGIIQAPTEMTDDAVTKDLSKPPEVTHDNQSFGNSTEGVVDAVLSSEEYIVSIKDEGNIPESERQKEVERELEKVEEPEQELVVQQAQQSVELVHEEAVIFDARQERMEEANDIEEFEKYAFREKEDD